MVYQNGINIIYDKKIPLLCNLATVIFLVFIILPEIDTKIHDDHSSFLLKNNLENPAQNESSKGIKHQDLCFYAEAEICQEYHPAQPNGCECFPHPTVPRSLVCCNITNIEKVNLCANLHNREYGNSSTWLNIHIRNATLDELDVSNQIWKQLNSLVITDGYIKRITQSFKRFSTIKCLNFSHNNLTEINPRAFRDLTSLQLLDISYNNISIMPNKISVQHNLTVDVSRNQALLCKSVLDSIDHFKFINQDATFCLINKTYSWFNDTENVPLSQLKRMKHVHTDCPSIPGYGNCSCVAERMSFFQKDDDTLLIFTVKVDCSGLGLTELPRNLPKDTRYLNVSRNKIKSLAAFTQDSTYEYVLRLDADDNEIESILELEGTRFIEEFQQLNLRKNKLKSIPIYIISNTLDKNPRGVEVHLGGNRLHCDCNTAKILRLWLLARQQHIVDFDNILCDNMPSKVVDLSEMKLCQSQHDWTDYIYYLIAAEIFLLIALVMKVSYDYWIFKTAGYLPWPANKMPKLPCDWLCES